MPFNLIISASFVRGFSPSASFDVGLVMRSRSRCPERPAPISAILSLSGSLAANVGLRGELGLLFLAGRPGPVWLDSGRPGVCMSHVRPAGRTQFGFWPAGRLPGCLCVGFVFGWPAGWLLRWLAGWLCLQLTKALAGWLAGCLASWLAGWLARLVGLATWFRILVKVSAK